MRKEEQELRAQLRARIAGLIVREEKREAHVRTSDGRGHETELSEWSIEIFLRDNRLVRLRTSHPREPNLDEIISKLLLYPDVLTLVLSGRPESP